MGKGRHVRKGGITRTQKARYRRSWPGLAGPAVVIALAALAGTASAHGAGSAHPEAWIRLVTIVLIMAAIIAGIVYGAILLAIWRYREGSPYVRKPPAEHDTKMETVWTMFPVIMVTLIVALSIQVMYETDEIPEEGVRIKVIGQQYRWQFIYPDNTTSTNELWVEEGQTVVFEIEATDVVHSFFLPDFFLKVDAFPGYYDEAWIVAEPAGDYDIWCAEYCGEEHTEMTGVLHIYPKGLSDKPYGPPPGEVPPPPEIEHVNVTLEISGPGGGPRPEWTITPSSIELPLDGEVTLRVWNNASEAFSLSLSPPYRRSIAEIPPGGSRYVNFTADKPTAGTTCLCQVVGGGYGEEVRATVTVVPKASDLPGYARDDGGTDGPWMALLIAMALLTLAVAVFAAVRSPGRTVDSEEGPGEEGPGEVGPGEKVPDGQGTPEPEVPGGEEAGEP